MVEFLDVDPGVIAALDRRQDDAAAAGVEQSDRGRLLAARARVGVVAYERGLGDRGVDPAIDPGKAGRDGKLYPGSWSEWEQLDLPVERD